MKPRVGWMGLGLMGRPMVRNLLRAGYPVTVWNRTAARAEELARDGAKVAATPREAAAASEVLFSIVSDPPALEAVLWGKDGAMEALPQGSVYVDSSTVSSNLARRIGEDCARRGAEFLDAPVTGGTWGAEKGELVFMIGGKQGVVARIQPVLDVLGKRFFLLGPNGAGQTVKLAMNLIIALEVDALAEALALVNAAGIAGEKLIEVMQSSMARAGVLDVKAPLMLRDEFAPSFPLRLMHKDLGLALEFANQAGVPLPATAAVREIYSAVKGASADDVDYAAVARFWRRKR